MKCMSCKEQATCILLNDISPKTGVVWDLTIANLHGILHENEFHPLYFGFSILLSLESTILVSTTWTN